MRNDSCQVGFANKQCHIHEHETYLSQLPASRVTFHLELFDINRTRTLHSILRVKNVFIKGMGGLDAVLFEADCAGRQSLKPEAGLPNYVIHHCCSFFLFHREGHLCDTEDRRKTLWPYSVLAFGTCRLMCSNLFY